MINSQEENLMLPIDKEERSVLGTDLHEDNLTLGIDPQVAFDKLAQFQTQDEIANYLTECEIKAVPGRIDSCALAVWFQQTTGYDRVEVTETILLAKDGNIWSDSRNSLIHFDANRAMMDFIESYDNEQYPELIDTEKYEITPNGCDSHCPCCGF